MQGFSQFRGTRPLAAAVVAFGLVGFVMGAAEAEPANVTLLLVNDLDRIAEDDGRGGFARFAAVVEAERAKGGHVLVLHAGDAISPSILSGFDGGAHIIELLNDIRPDAFALGNHEFDFGPDVLAARVDEAEFTMLGANVRQADGSPIPELDDMMTATFGDYTIGIVGVVTSGVTVKSSPGDLQIANPLDTVAAKAAELREAGADLVVALGHLAVPEDFALREAGTADIILSGDDHHLLTYYDGRTLLAESASQADYVTAIDLTLDRVESRGNLRFEWHPNFRIIDTAHVTPDPEIAAAVSALEAELDEQLNVVIGKTGTELDSRRATIRGQEAAIGNLIADAMRAEVGADIGLTNGGGIRADRVYAPGSELTRRAILEELPFGNKTVMLELSGADVLAALENGFSAVEDGSGRFPHLSGMTVEVDLSRPAGARVLSAKVGDAALDAGATYTLATNDFVARGGDGYASFKGAKRIVDALAGKLMASSVIDYIAEKGEVAPAIEGRIALR